ncbi:MAG: hypothetical protein ABMB14_10285 [Myxococcota bacterium]
MRRYATRRSAPPDDGRIPDEPERLRWNRAGHPVYPGPRFTLLSACVAEPTATTKPVDADPSTGPTTGATSDTTPTPTAPPTDADTDTGTVPGTTDTAPVDLGPQVDRSDPALRELEFTALDADSEATVELGVELAALDTRVAPIGRLVVYLHGAGSYSSCGAYDHAEMLGALGFHVFMPCYVAGYGVDNCGDDIGGCRLEAFEGVDHHTLIDVEPPDAIERRVVRGLQHLQAIDPGGDWQYFLDGELPRWDHIVISGISHGASSSGLIAKFRTVDRAVMLSGPLDTDQQWLVDPSVTPIDRFRGFTHTDDDQHTGHLAAYDDLGLVGAPVFVDGVAPPYDGSHRLESSAATSSGHESTQAGWASPLDPSGGWLFQPVWTQLYTGSP